MSIQKKFLKKLSSFRKIEMAVDFFSGCVQFIIYSSFLLLIWLCLDNWIHLSDEWRWVAFICFYFLLTWVGLGTLKNINNTKKDEKIALRLEKYNSYTNSLLMNAWCFCKKVSKLNNLEKFIIRKSLELIHRSSFFKRLTWSRIKKTTIIFIGIISIILGYKLYFSNYYQNGLNRLLLPWKEIRPETRVKVSFKEGKHLVNLGESKKYSFRITKGSIKNALIRFRLDGEEYFKNDLIRINNDLKFNYSFENVRKNIEWYLYAGDLILGPHFVNVLYPPKIVKNNWVIRKPDYLGSNEIVKNGVIENIKINNGSFIHVNISLDLPCDELNIVDLSGKKVTSFQKKVENTWQANLTLNDTQTIRFRYDRGQESGLLEEKIKIVVVKDLAPKVLLMNEQAVRLSPEEDVLDIGVKCYDDHQLDRVVLQYRKTGDANWLDVDQYDIKKNVKEFKRKWFLPRKKFDFSPGTRVEFKFVVYDNSPRKYSESSSIKEYYYLSWMESRFDSFEVFMKLKDLLQSWISNYHFGLLEGRSSKDFLTIINTQIDKYKKNTEKLKRIGSLDSKIFKVRKSLSELQKFNPSLQFIDLSQVWLSFFGDMLTIWQDIQSIYIQLYQSICYRGLEEVEQGLGSLRNLGHKGSKKIKEFLVNYLAFKNSFELMKVNLEERQEKLLLPIQYSFIKTLDNLEMEKELNHCSSLVEKRQIEEASLVISRLKDRWKKEVYHKVKKVPSKVKLTKRAYDEISSLRSKVLTLIMWLKSAPLEVEPILSELSVGVNNITLVIKRLIAQYSSMQERYRGAGLKGLTFLNASLFELNEFKSWVKNGRLLKAKSKMKKCVKNLESFSKELSKWKFKDEKVIESVDDVNTIIPSSGAVEGSFEILDPIASQSIGEQGVITIIGAAKCRDGIESIHMDCIVRDSYGVKKNQKQLQIEDFVEVVSEAEVTVEFSPLQVSAQINDSIEISLIAFEAETERKIFSKPLWLQVEEPRTQISYNDFFRQKFRVKQILKQVQSISQDISSQLSGMESDFFQGGEKLLEKSSKFSESVTKFADMFNTVHSSLKNMTTMGVASEDFDFRKGLQLSNHVKEDLNKLSNYDSHLSQISKQDDKSSLTSLFNGVKNKLENISANLNGMRRYFGSNKKRISRNSSQATEVNREIIDRVAALKQMSIQASERLNSDSLSEVKSQLNEFSKLIQKSELYTDESRILLEQMESFLNVTSKFDKDISKVLGNFSLKSRELERLLTSNVSLKIKEELREKIETGEPSQVSNMIEQLDSLGQNNGNLELLKVNQSNINGLNESKEKVRIITKAALSEVQLEPIGRILLSIEKYKLLEEQLIFLERSDFNKSETVGLLTEVSKLVDIFDQQIQTIPEKIKTDSEKEKSEFNGAWKKLKRVKKNIEESLSVLVKKASDGANSFMKENHNVWLTFLKGTNATVDSNASETQSKFTKQYTELNQNIEKIFDDLSDIKEDFKSTLSQWLLQYKKMLLSVSIAISKIDISIDEMQSQFVRAIFMAELSLENNRIDFALFFLKQARNNIQLFRNYFSQLSDFLTNWNYQEFLSRGISRIEEKLKEVSATELKIKNRIDDLSDPKKSLSNQEKEELESLILEKAKIENIKDIYISRRKGLLNRGTISISTSPALDYQKPAFTSLSTGEKRVKNLLRDSIDPRNIALDQKILQNLKDELSEIKSNVFDKDIKLQENKILGNMKRLGFDVSGQEEARKKIIKNQIELSRKKKQDSLAQVLQKLGDATKFSQVEDQSKITPEEKELNLDEKYRYLRKVEKQKENLKRIQDTMKQGALLSEKFRQLTEKMLLESGRDIEELRQVVRGAQWTEKLPRVVKTLNKIESMFKKELKVIYENAGKTENKQYKALASGLDFLSVSPVSGFESAMDYYLLAITKPKRN